MEYLRKLRMLELMEIILIYQLTSPKTGIKDLVREISMVKVIDFKIKHKSLN